MEESKPQGFRILSKFSRKRIFLILILLILVGGVGTGVLLVKASDNPDFCTMCHIMKPYYDSWYDSSLLANKHAAEGLVCHDCHESTVTVQVEEGFKYVTGNYENPLTQREFSREFCLECHSDFKEIVTKTNFSESNPHESPHYEDMECNLCHNMHTESEVYCAQCHEFEWQGSLDNEWQNI